MKTQHSILAHFMKFSYQIRFIYSIVCYLNLRLTVKSLCIVNTTLFL